MSQRSARVRAAHPTPAGRSPSGSPSRRGRSHRSRSCAARSIAALAAWLGVACSSAPPAASGDDSPRAPAGEAYFPGAPAYPGARLLCSQHVTGPSAHIAWRGYATADPVDAVRAFYEARVRPPAVLERRAGGFAVRGAEDRVVSVHAAGSGHPTCGVAHAATDRTYLVVSQRTAR